MNKIRDFLSLTQKQFNEILESLPPVFAEEDGKDVCVNTVCTAFLTDLVERNTLYAWVDSCDFKKRELEIEDLYSYDELSRLKELLKGWKISNESTIIEALKNGERQNYIDTITEYIESAPTNNLLQITQMIRNYDSKPVIV